ncbi:YtxH domain-containing protein [Thalassobacillus sp. CUG 92003]|uniref:YtxH domain-containing protein n=1 Tax=Thalassobacillus sp. CUG 92003 TaxID=2736641 RepID=UPI0015E6B59D|nr:YtxH domain-containing protein [Thalassobacillus sp. CUG 92003]
MADLQNKAKQSKHVLNNNKGVITGTLIGGVVGATTSLLFAPKAGKEMRSDLSEQSKKAVDKSKRLKDNTSEKSQKVANKFKKSKSDHEGNADVDSLPVEQGNTQSEEEKTDTKITANDDTNQS